MLTLLLTTLSLFSIFTPAFANPPNPADTVYIPEKLGLPVPNKSGTCERMLRIGTEIFPCDSPVATDAENLRTYLLNTPDAIKELDIYQNNRKRMRLGAYIGSAGIALVLTHSLIAKLFYGNHPQKEIKQDELASKIRITGIAVTVGTVLYGISFLKGNESHLNHAIDLYNEKNQNRKIEFIIQTRF